VAFNRLLGCACIFSLNNGTFGCLNFGGVRNGAAFFLRLYLVLGLTSQKLHLTAIIAQLDL